MKVGGNTATEILLNRVGRLAFLTLWSFPNPHRRQLAGGKHSEGKELCDLLVVFGNDVVIFSDKQSRYRNTGNIEVDWKRWYKRAIRDSVRQIRGAERWIKTRPDLLFADAELRQPIAFPDPQHMRIHRVAIAHGLSNEFGTGPSQTFDPTEPLAMGFDYFESQDVPFPFFINDVRERDFYVHVIEGYVIERVIRSLDTTPDFINYLASKEDLARKVGHILVGSELDLLAYHLQHINDHGRHGLDQLKGYESVLIEEGMWDEFVESGAIQRRIDADKLSYVWDNLIELLSVPTTLTADPKTLDLKERETILRLMASSNRLHRRMLGQLFSEVLERPLDPLQRFARVVYPIEVDQPYYVFVSIDRPAFSSWEDYLQARRNLLEGYLLALRLKESKAHHIVGIIINTGGLGPFSCDAMYYDGWRFHDAQRGEIVAFAEKLGIFKDLQRKTGRVIEYPEIIDPTKLKGRDRNAACFCGSGKKYKHCCLPRKADDHNH